MGERLIQLGGRVAAADTEEDLVRPLLRLLVHSSGMELAAMTLPAATPGMQRIAYVHDAGGIGIPEGYELPWEDTLCNLAFDVGRLYVHCAGTAFAELEIARLYGIRTFLTVPVQLPGEVFGTVCAASRHEVAMLTAAAWVPELIARLLAEHLARARLLSELDERC